MYRVVVYRTNDCGEELCYCCSRRFDSFTMARKFAIRQNGKPNRISKIVKITIDK